MDRQGRNSAAGVGAIARSLGWLGGAVAWTIAAAFAAVMAVVLAATVVAAAFVASLLLAIAGAVIKARRALRRSADPSLIEARKVGGHSWVAYGWDGPA